MSMRPAEETPTQQQTAASAMRLRADIDQARAVQEPIAEATTGATQDVLNFDDLTETEKSAAMIGVSPDDWKPIGFMNTQHYKTLLQNNALDGNLAQGIEAYKQVAGGISPVA